MKKWFTGNWLLIALGGVAIIIGIASTVVLYSRHDTDARAVHDLQLIEDKINSDWQNPPKSISELKVDGLYGKLSQYTYTLDNTDHVSTNYTLCATFQHSNGLSNTTGSGSGNFDIHRQGKQCFFIQYSAKNGPQIYPQFDGGEQK